MMRPLVFAWLLPASPAPRAARLAAASAAVLALLTAGCASTSPDYDSLFGDATRVLNAQQLIDPQAAQRNADAVPPTDGRTMREAMDRQVESYKKPPPTSVVNIGLSGGTGN
jgi:hypothetical protein